jgi:Tol biopolymer transport system component
MSGDRTHRVFASSKESELNGTFSPDGRRVAYQSNASGRYEDAVRPFPDEDPARTISRDGGSIPTGEKTARSCSSWHPPGR